MRVLATATRDARLRVAHPGDAPALARVHVASWHAAYADILPAEELRRTTLGSSTDRFARDLDLRRHLVHVVEDHRGIYGYAAIGRQPIRALPFAGEIFELYVLPERWREGAGRRLFTRALWTLVEHRLNPVMLWVLTENVRGRRFYEACGGRPVARAPIEFGELRTEKLAYGWHDGLPLPAF